MNNQLKYKPISLYDFVEMVKFLTEGAHYAEN